MKKNTKISILIAASILLIAAVFIIWYVKQPIEPPLETLRMSFQPSTHHVAFVVADEKGWWERDLRPFGVKNITVSPPFPAGPPQMAAMVAGEHDVAIVGAAPAILAISRGLNASIVASVQTQGSCLVLRTNLTYKNPADLKGLRIATFPPGSIQHTILSGWLIKNNLTPGVDVRIVEMGPGPAKAAIAVPTVDAVFLPHPSPTIIEDAGTGRVIVSSGEMMPGHLCCVLVVTNELIREHPEVVEQLVRTFINSTKFVDANRNESAEIFARRLGMPPELVKRSFAEWDGIWITDPTVVVPSALELARTKHRIGVIDRMPTQEMLFNLTFYQKARR